MRAARIWGSLFVLVLTLQTVALLRSQEILPSLARMNGPRREFTTSVLLNGEILLAGGLRSEGTAETYSYLGGNDGNFSSTGPLRQARGGTSSHRPP